MESCGVRRGFRLSHKQEEQPKVSEQRISYQNDALKDTRRATQIRAVPVEWTSAYQELLGSGPVWAESLTAERRSVTRKSTLSVPLILTSSKVF